MLRPLNMWELYIAVDCWIGLNRVVTSKDTVLLICLNQRSGVKTIPQHCFNMCSFYLLIFYTSLRPRSYGENLSWVEWSPSQACFFMWTQACPEGMCTNGTLVPCEVPSLAPGSTSRTFFEQWCGFFYVPQEQISVSAMRRELRFFVLIRNLLLTYEEKLSKPTFQSFPITHVHSSPRFVRKCMKRLAQGRLGRRLTLPPETTFLHINWSLRNRRLKFFFHRLPQTWF